MQKLSQCWDLCLFCRSERLWRSMINISAPIVPPPPTLHSVYHHKTYNGMVQRQGTWNHHTKGHLNWPEELAAPVYDRFTKDWRDMFGRELPSHVKYLLNLLQQASKELHETIQKEVVSAGCRTAAQIQALQHGVDLDWLADKRTSELLRRLKDHGVDVHTCGACMQRDGAHNVQFCACLRCEHAQNVHICACYQRDCASKVQFCACLRCERAQNVRICTCLQRDGAHTVQFCACLRCQHAQNARICACYQRDCERRNFNSFSLNVFAVF